MSGKKCKHCGSSEIEVDPARGDAVCTNCGTVLEDNIIVAEVEFQENAHGGASAIGQFVSAESKGGATGFGGALCQQLRLNQQCIDIACNFFKMALSRHLTIGRPASHTQAAYLLIDISDALQICCYQLGRTYFRLSRALCINIPPTAAFRSRTVGLVACQLGSRVAAPGGGAGLAVGDGTELEDPQGEGGPL
ncbi:hypothetical protein MSG28_007050 [Choristoneura fumiferana]|uniref:Uncharacterized protein n=1 Tax=Choristoneura fumiferana TaxID=7141 RepID=A0ACC0JMD7_CHOFU|nr:hypothetical protein MSG28_007050 [Choristoneura fumiferana]